MIKRSCFKCSLMAGLIITGINLCFLIAIIIYQSASPFTGISETPTTVTSCPTAYFNTKQSAATYIKVISYIFVCIELALTIITFIFLLLGFIKFRETIILQLDD